MKVGQPGLGHKSNSFLIMIAFVSANDFNLIIRVGDVYFKSIPIFTN